MIMHQTGSQNRVVRALCDNSSLAFAVAVARAQPVRAPVANVVTHIRVAIEKQLAVRTSLASCLQYDRFVGKHLLLVMIIDHFDLCVINVNWSRICVAEKMKGIKNINWVLNYLQFDSECC